MVAVVFVFELDDRSLNELWIIARWSDTLYDRTLVNDVTITPVEREVRRRAVREM